MAGAFHNYTSNRYSYSRFWKRCCRETNPRSICFEVGIKTGFLDVARFGHTCGPFAKENKENRDHISFDVTDILFTFGFGLVMGRSLHVTMSVMFPRLCQVSSLFSVKEVKAVMTCNGVFNLVPFLGPIPSV